MTSSRSITGQLLAREYSYTPRQFRIGNTTFEWIPGGPWSEDACRRLEELRSTIRKHEQQTTQPLLQPAELRGVELSKRCLAD